MNAGVPPSIFIDDYDPEIVYKGNWTASNGIFTGLTGLPFPGENRTSWYGTLHTSSGNAGLSYIFEGTAIRAALQSTNASAVTSCAIDGIEQGINLLGEGIICTSNSLLPDGKHNLKIAVGSKEVSFDGLFYTPSQMPASGVDVAYHALNESTGLPIIIPSKTQMKMPGHRLQFDFHGNSMGLYGKLSFIHGAKASLSYALDDEPPVNFSLSAPSTNIHFLAEWQLIVQTPPLHHGPHTFQMILLDVNPTRNDTSIAPQLIVIQNTTIPRNLDAVPPILSLGMNTSPTSQPTQKSDGAVNKGPSISKGALIGVVIGATMVLILILCIYFIKRVVRRRNRRDVGENALTLPSPFLPEGKRKFRLSQHIPRSKLESHPALHCSDKYEYWQNNDREETQSSGLRSGMNTQAGQSNEWEKTEEENASLPPSYTVFRHR